LRAVGLYERLSNYREPVDNSMAFNHHESEIFYLRETIWHIKKYKSDKKRIRGIYNAEKTGRKNKCKQAKEEEIV